MGSFVFSNQSLRNSEKSIKLLESKGHSKVFERKGSWGHLLYANKILLDGENFLLIDDSSSDPDFILGVGTFIYHEKYGISALKELYRDFSIEVAVKQFPIYGHFAFVIKKQGKIYVFGDNFGTLKLYYSEDNGQYIISNSQVSGVICNMEKPVFEKAKLSAFLAEQLCSEIPFVKGVHIFDSNNVLIFKEGGKTEIIKKQFPQIPRIEKMDEAINYCKNLFKEQMEALQAFKNKKFSVELTGGLDSRLISANINSSGFEYDFVNYGLYGADSEIAQIVSSGMNKSLVIIDDPKDNDFYKIAGEFDLGYDFFRHYPSKRWSIPNIIQFSGLYGECLTTSELITDTGVPKDKTKIESMLPMIVLSNMMPKECQTNLIKDLESFFIQKGFAVDSLLNDAEMDVFTRLVSGLLTRDYLFISACNTCMYFYSIFNEWHFGHFVSDISSEIKDRRKLSIAMIKAIDPKVSKYPFVSRLRTRRSSVDEVEELTSVYKSYNWYKEHLPKFFVNYIYGKVGRTFPKSYINQIDFDRYKDVIDIKLIQKYPNVYNGILKRLFSIEVVRKELGMN